MDDSSRKSMYQLRKEGLPAKSVSIPEEGVYELRNSETGKYEPVRIWFGPSFDEYDEDGSSETSQRSPCWHAIRAGKEVEVESVWPWCSGRVITMDQYRTMLMEGLDNV